MELLVEDALSMEAEEGAEGSAEAGAGAAGAEKQVHPLLKQGPLAKPASMGLPQRVLLPWTVRGTAWTGMRTCMWGGSSVGLRAGSPFTSLGGVLCLTPCLQPDV